MKTMKNSLLALAFLMSCAAFAMAWDDVGHKMTAYTAWQQMTPAAREWAIKTMRQAPEDSQLATFYMVYGPETDKNRQLEFFMTAATWADIVRDREFPVRNKKYHHGTWHYSDIFWRQTDSGVEEISGMKEGGEAVERLYEFEKLINDKNAKDADKAIAIAWILHIVGDLHQPLHTSARVTDIEPKGDQGGNLFLLTPQGTKREDSLNLHWYWDSIVVRNMPLKGDLCGRNYVAPMTDKLMKKYPYRAFKDTLNYGKYEDWRKESFEFNPSTVFSKDLKRFETPSDKYKKAALKAAEKRLIIAGYRIAEILNKAAAK